MADDPSTAVRRQRNLTNTTSGQTALRFLRKLPGMPADGETPFADPVVQEVYNLVWAAFSVYLTQTGMTCDRWQYPWEVLQRGESFTGGEPWAILLREAYERAITHRLIGE